MTTLYSDNFNDNTLSGVWTVTSGSYGTSEILEQNEQLEITTTYSGDDGYNGTDVYQEDIDEYIDVRIKMVTLSGSTVSGTFSYYVGYLFAYNNGNDRYYGIDYYDLYYFDTHIKHIAAYGPDGSQEIDDKGTPVWLRITYGGRVFQFYYSLNGSDWVKIYQEAYNSTPDLNVGFACNTNTSGTLIVDDFVAAEKSADPVPLPYGLQIYKDNELQFDLNDGVKYIIYTTTVSGGDSGSTFIPITGDRRYTCLSYAKEYGYSEHTATVSDITSSGITLNWTAETVGTAFGGEGFHGMPSGDSIIYVMGY